MKRVRQIRKAIASTDSHFLEKVSVILLTPPG